MIGNLAHGDNGVQALAVCGAFATLVIDQMGDVITQTAVDLRGGQHAVRMFERYDEIATRARDMQPGIVENGDCHLYPQRFMSQSNSASPSCVDAQRPYTNKKSLSRLM